MHKKIIAAILIAVLVAIIGYELLNTKRTSIDGSILTVKAPAPSPPIKINGTVGTIEPSPILATATASGLSQGTIAPVIAVAGAAPVSGNATLSPTNTNTINAIIKQAASLTPISVSGGTLSTSATQNLTNAVTQVAQSGGTVAEAQSVAVTLAQVSDLQPYPLTITQALFDSNGKPAGQETFTVTFHAQTYAEAVAEAESAYQHVLSVS